MLFVEPVLSAIHTLIHLIFINHEFSTIIILHLLIAENEKQRLFNDIARIRIKC